VAVCPRRRWRPGAGTIPVAGGDLAYEVLAGDTEPVLAIHGISSHRRLWHRARRTVTGEHGVGLRKRDGMRRELNPLAVQLQRSIKAALDPVGIFNPGKVL